MIKLMPNVLDHCLLLKVFWLADNKKLVVIP